MLGFIFLLFFGFAMAWIGILIGLSVRSARVANAAVFIAVFPLTFLSNAFAPTTGTAEALQYFGRMESCLNDGCSLPRAIWTSKYLWSYGKFLAEPESARDVLNLYDFDNGGLVPLSIRKYVNVASK